MLQGKDVISVIKRTIGVIIVLALVAITAYSYLSPNRTSATLELVTTETENDDGTIISIITYVDEDGRAVVASDKRYAIVRKTKKDDLVILEEYLDAGGSPATLSSGYSSIKREYEDGLNTIITYLDEEGYPVIVSSGYETIKRTYNDKRLSDTDTYWIGVTAEGPGTQVQRKQGYWSLHRIYGTGADRKRVVRQEYRGENGRLVLNSSGYAYFERKYNETGKIAEVRYYGADGEPVSIGNRYYGYLREYDDQGRTIQTTYIDEDGQPSNTSRGYTVVKTFYDDAGTKTLYYDVDGYPVTIGHNQYGEIRTEDGSAYLNEDGEYLLRLDNLLYSNPVIVLIFGMIVSMMALLVQGKWRTAFIVIYGAFILYMTIAYRESGTVNHARLNLFWSYRQFMSNKSLQRQILSNIWLFVPFGAAMCNALRARSSDWKALVITTAICLAFSSVIEAFQFSTGIGLCELDDVVSNSLGGLIGAIGSLAAHHISSKQRMSVKTRTEEKNNGLASVGQKA